MQKAVGGRLAEGHVTEGSSALQSGKDLDGPDESPPHPMPSQVKEASGRVDFLVQFHSQCTNPFVATLAFLKAVDCTGRSRSYRLRTRGWRRL